MKTSNQEGGFQLTITPMKDGVPPIIRLRRVLKILLRGYGFRCVSVRAMPPKAKTRKRRA